VRHRAKRIRLPADFVFEESVLQEMLAGSLLIPGLVFFLLRLDPGAPPIRSFSIVCQLSSTRFS